MTRLHEWLDPTRRGRAAESLECRLRKCIVGQDDAIEQIVKIYQMHLSGLCAKDRPIGNLLFLGPTGSGKTHIVEATAEALVGNSRAIIKLDCGEFQHSHEIAKLIGSPPGYLGHRETHPLLSQEMLNQHQTDNCRMSFVLFDEIEKASDVLWNLLLGILDKATLTLGDNRRVDFSCALIFMTTNLGAREMSNVGAPKLGFRANDPSRNMYSDGRLETRMANAGLEAARRRFAPEFMNRLDKIVVFKSLGDTELRKILDIELRKVQQRVLTGNTMPFVLTCGSAAKDFLLREGTDLIYGARHLKRAIERHLVQPLSNLIATAQIRAGDSIRVDYDTQTGHMVFMRDGQDIPPHVMAEVGEAVIPLAAFAQARGAGAEKKGGWRRAS
jgi:ATP-dependent Clp protease ATP-binding subunit ClpB